MYGGASRNFNHRPARLICVKPPARALDYRRNDGEQKIMLTEQEKAQLARTLEARRHELAREIGEKMADSRARGGSANVDQIIEGGDAALADSLAGLDLAEAQRDLAELRDIEAARARMADGSYGICVDCGEPIAPARLQAYPTAKRCTDCQTVHERRSASARPRL